MRSDPIFESTAEVGLDAFPPKVGTPSLDMATQFAANQTWEVLPDPAGSTLYIVKNQATGHCIDIREKSLNPGAALDVRPAQSNDNENQLWDFLPDPFGSGPCFIQNPQTGYVIEIADGSPDLHSASPAKV
jgi:Ricin-type beta-trefoil lectin domain-like